MILCDLKLTKFLTKKKLYKIIKLNYFSISISLYMKRYDVNTNINIIIYIVTYFYFLLYYYIILLAVTTQFLKF